MPQDIYDVIIVGSGPAGMVLARYLDTTKIRTLLIEKDSLKSHNPKIYGTFTDAVQRNNLKPFICNYFDTWAYYGPTFKAHKTIRKSICLVDFAKLKRKTRFRQVKAMARTRIVAARRVKGGIALKDQRKRTCIGRIVVDASGYEQIIARLLGMPLSKKRGYAYEFELKNCSMPITDEAAFLLNFTISNSGGWYYPLSKKRAQFGWADFCPESPTTLKGIEKRVRKAVQTLAPFTTWLKNAEVTYKHGRPGPITDVTNIVDDNFLAIGDGGGMGTPVTLEGFREAIDSARYAFEAIQLAVTMRDSSKRALSRFAHRFHRRYGRYYKWHRLMRFIYTHGFRDEEIDEWFRTFQRLNVDDYFRTIRGQITPLLLLKITSARLALNITLNLINNLLPAPLCFRKKITVSREETVHETL